MISIPSRRGSSLVLGLLSVALVCGAAIGYPTPRNCQTRYECPPFTVLLSNTNFEIRSYDAAQWASSPAIPAQSLATGSNVGFSMVFHYFNGGNQQGEKIKVTRPVLVDVENSTYTTHLYLPKEYQTATKPPPSPLPSDQVKVEKFPTHKLAAVTRVAFEETISETTIQRELGALKQGLEATIYKRAAAVDRYSIGNYIAFTDPNLLFIEIFLWFD